MTTEPDASRVKAAVQSAVLLVTLVCSGCDALTFARGRVRDSQGQPVSNASVILTRSDEGRYWRTVTGADGCFSLGGLTGSNRHWLLVVSKDDHKSLRVDGKELSSRDFDITLSPLSGDRRSEYKRVGRTDLACDWNKTPSAFDAWSGPTQ